MTSTKRLPIVFLLALLAGCASHRPPACKGLYTPIQPAGVEVPHGP